VTALHPDSTARAAQRRARWAAHSMDCGDCEWGNRAHSCCIGIVRCADGDSEAFDRGVAQIRDWACVNDDVRIEPPTWGLYRWNPDWTRFYTGLLAEVDKPGRGVWHGALVLIATERNGRE
jgi:hypothetical protein